MRHLVIGAGEVGTAVHEVLSTAWEVSIRDLHPVEIRPAHMIHICFPWSDRFAQDVDGHRRLHEADHVVVHSTVPVGTCDPHGWTHSPVRGRHPHLAESLLTFTKHFGGQDAELAASAFNMCLVQVKIHDRAAETEAAKLWELTSYGLAVVLEKQIHAYCQEHDLDFDIVYTRFAESYNAGYTAMGHPEFMRPVLTHMPGPIGGHCVVPGAEMLDHDLAKLVVEAS